MWKSEEMAAPSDSWSSSGGAQANVDRSRAATGGGGRTVVIKGELNASEDLTLEGQVEGKIEMLQNILTVGTGAKLQAEIFAKSVVVLGEVVGNVTASERLEIRANGSVEGDVVAPKIAIAEGAHFRGRIEMRVVGDLRPATGTVLPRKPEPVSSAPAATFTPNSSTPTRQAG